MPDVDGFFEYHARVGTVTRVLVLGFETSDGVVLIGPHRPVPDGGHLS